MAVAAPPGPGAPSSTYGGREAAHLHMSGLGTATKRPHQSRFAGPLRKPVPVFDSL